MQLNFEMIDILKRESESCPSIKRKITDEGKVNQFKGSTWWQIFLLEGFLLKEILYFHFSHLKFLNKSTVFYIYNIFRTDKFPTRLSNFKLAFHYFSGPVSVRLIGQRNHFVSQITVIDRWRFPLMATIMLPSNPSDRLILPIDSTLLWTFPVPIKVQLPWRAAVHSGSQ